MTSGHYSTNRHFSNTVKPMDIKPSRKERAFSRREEEILQATRELFSIGAWESVTVADIAIRAEVGKGTVYKHFARKEEIYARLALDFGASLLNELDQLPRVGNAIDDLYALTRMAFRWHLDDPIGNSLCKFTDRPEFQQRLSLEYQQQFRDQHDRFERFFAGLLAQGVAQGLFPQVPMAPVLYGTHAAFLGALEMIRTGMYQMPNPAVSEEVFLEHVTDYMLAGILGMGTLLERNRG
ncbi:MAG: TetR/AcrR family transcriptional regulator [Magnetococcales bacterium]|nr:TetR/AcrR family transcriptional regulator [Magnetococcales bacterium]